MNNEDALGRFAAILLYHRLGWPKLRSRVRGQYVVGALLKSQIKYLRKRRWQPDTLYNTLAGSETTDSNRFVVTFDDGYLSVYDKAFPILKDAGVNATVYVVSGQIGGFNRWDWETGDCVEQMMSAEQIVEIHEAGFEIGSHTCTHPHLTRLSDSQLLTEVCDSKKHLEDLLGCEVRSFSYPYGDCDQRVKDAVMQAGYRNAVATKLGVYTPGTDVFEVPRVNVRWNTFGAALVSKIDRGVKNSLGG